MIIILSTLSNKLMSLISINQFDEFIEANPEMEQCYDEELFNPFLPADELEDYYSCEDGISYED